jgi:hypothetical protein
MATHNFKLPIQDVEYKKDWFSLIQGFLHDLKELVASRLWLGKNNEGYKILQTPTLWNMIKIIFVICLEICLEVEDFIIFV